ncbi:hypothetical protein ABIE67_008896 [Streptomyces sp. V4I8]
MEFGALFAGLQVAVEEPLDGTEALVHGFPGEAAPAGRGGLAAGRVEVVAQGGQQVGAMAGVVLAEAAELSFRVVLDPGVLAEGVQQTAQTDVGQFVEGAVRREGLAGRGGLGGAGRLAEGAGRVGEVRDFRPS